MNTNVPRLSFEMLTANRQRMKKWSARRRLVKRIGLVIGVCCVLTAIVLWKINPQIGSTTADELYQRAVDGFGKFVSFGQVDG